MSLERTKLHHYNIYRANKYTEIYLTPLGIRKKQINTSLRKHTLLVDWQICGETNISTQRS